MMGFDYNLSWFGLCSRFYILSLDTAFYPEIKGEELRFIYKSRELQITSASLLCAVVLRKALLDMRDATETDRKQTRLHICDISAGLAALKMLLCMILLR